MKLSELTLEQAGRYIAMDRDLDYSFMDYVRQCSIDNCIEKLDCFEPGCVDYCVNGYNTWDYVKVANERYYDFLFGMNDVRDEYTLSTRCEKSLNHCWNLARTGSNLFRYSVDKLAELFYEDEIKVEMDYADGCDPTDGDYLDAVDCFMSNHDCDIQEGKIALA